MNFITKASKPIFKAKTLDNSIKYQKVEAVKAVGKVEIVVCLN